MANERRVRQGFLSGLIDDNPLSNSATTLNSTELAGLEAIDSTEHAVLVLDPTGAGNGPEVVYITAHTGSATSATIARGREGTSGVQHASTITWVHVATVHDYNQTLTTAPSGTGLPYEGQLWTDVTNDRLMSGDASNASQRIAHYSSSGRTGVRLRRAANQSMTNATLTSVSWDTEDVDSDGFISVASTTITIPAGLGGLYNITFMPEFVVAATYTDLLAAMVTGGETYYWPYAGIGLTPAGGERLIYSLSSFPLAAADTVVFRLLQTSSASRNFLFALDMFRVAI
jgi:hypothetical protein